MRFRVKRRGCRWADWVRGCCSLLAGVEVAWIGTVTVAKERKGLIGEVLRRRSGSWEPKILPWLGIKDTCPLLLLEQ